MSSATIQVIYPMEGTLMVPGSKLLDIKVDLSLAASHDCPPVSFHRIALRDRVWLRRLLVPLNAELAVGTKLALFSTTADESLDVAPAREVRTSMASILQQTDYWD
ncbi:MAG: hypothetical protein GC184_14395 [Rhizobiales bacterium]|nr:hypothetical protein [Hyphomicrobiales bacterium]